MAFMLLYEKGVRRFYVGGALGVDMWAGEQLLNLKEQPGYEEIEIMIVLPFEGHDGGWDERSRKRMRILKQRCTECLVIGKNNSQKNYIKRNCFMVDHSDYMVAVYDNERSLESGTMQAVDYAEQRGLYIVLIHPDTADVIQLI